MQYGDLSNITAPRIYVVFEGLAGRIPEDAREEHDRLMASRKIDWFKVLNCYKPSGSVINRINWLTWKKNINISVITWLGYDVDYPLSVWCTKNHVNGASEGWVLQDFINVLLNQPETLEVYDPDPSHQFTFGSKGIITSDPNKIGGSL